MAIKIKSGDIFEIQNNKILDNAYKKINIYTNEILDNIDYETSIANIKHETTDFLTNSNNASTDLANGIIGNYTKYESYAYLKTYYTSFVLQIDRYQNNNFTELLKVLGGVNSNGNANIEYNVTWQKITGIANAYNVPSTTTSEMFDYFQLTPQDEEITTGKIEVNSEGNVVNSYYNLDNPSSGVVVSLIDQSNYKNATVSTTNNNNYSISLTLLVGKLIIDAKSQFESANTTRNLTGTYEYYKPISVTIGLKGDKQYYTTQDIPLSIGDGNKEFQLESNELNQDTAFGRKYHDDINVTISGDAFYDYTATITTALDYDLYIDVSFSNIQSMQISTHTFVITQGKTSSNPYSVGFSSTNTIIKYIYQYLPLNSILLNRQLERYKNGIETMTLKCKVGNYYDTSGNKKISIDNDSLPMLFNINDIVIPYMLKSSITPYMQITDSMETPISISKDGTAKKFKVISTKLIFSGALWQEIVLQESK